jgi:hypothetical protein
MATVRTPLTGGELATLERIVSRLRRNIPRNGWPARFHEEKSEIANDLVRVIGALRTGQRLPDIQDPTDELAHR